MLRAWEAIEKLYLSRYAEYYKSQNYKWIVKSILLFYILVDNVKTSMGMKLCLSVRSFR